MTSKALRRRRSGPVSGALATGFEILLFLCLLPFVLLVALSRRPRAPQSPLEEERLSP